MARPGIVGGVGPDHLSIRTRLVRGARVVPGPRRELISRAYDPVLRATFRNGFYAGGLHHGKWSRVHLLR
ncbi:MAG TPA: hypothetical protein VFW24_12015 [Acidimicrobiales bacterium]|nr:hypothetical protein [Acidimicrobiales bacterium]